MPELASAAQPDPEPPAPAPAGAQPSSPASAPAGGEQGGRWWRGVERSVALLVSVSTLIAAGAALVTVRQAGGEQRLTRDGQVTDRYTAAVANLGATAEEVRIGGLYALQRIAQDSPRDTTTVAQVISAYIRSHAPLPKKGAKPFDRPANDIDAALHILTAPLAKDVPLDLHGSDLAGADLHGSDLSNANLAAANLHGADLSLSVLVDADMGGPDLHGARLIGAELRGGDLTNADLSGANLTHAALSLIVLADADLSGAYLTDVDLRDAILTGANLTHAILFDANLTDANLTDTNLHGADLTFARGYKPPPNAKAQQTSPPTAR